MPAETPPVWKQEEDLLEALRKTAPPAAWLLVVNCQPGPAGTPAYASAYLTRSEAGEWAAGSLPELPAALRKRFVALLAAMRDENPGAAWDACRVTLPFDLLEAYRYDFQQKVTYGCRTAREGNVDPADYAAAYELPAPDALLAQVQARSAELDRQRRLNPALMEQALLQELLPALPPDCQQVLVRYEAELADPAASLRGIYLTTGGDEARAQPLPALPAAVATAFADFRRASVFQSGNDWTSVEALVRTVLDEYGDDQLAVDYFFDESPPLRGLLKEAPAGESPAEFAARVQAALSAPPDVEDDYEQPAARPTGAAPAPAAAPKPTTWVCTWCKQTYTSAKQPTSFQPDKCPRNPGKAHAWHKK